MSFESWRRALLVRSGVFGTLQREWRRDRKDDAGRLTAELQRVSREIAALRQSIEQLHSELRTLGARARQRDNALERLSGEIATLGEDAGLAKARAAQLQLDVTRAHLALTVNAEHRDRRHAAALDAPRIAAHVTGRIGSAEVRLDPMPNLLIDDFLPADTNDALLSAIPPPEFFSQRDPVKRNFKVSRGRLAPEWTLHAWTFFEHTIIAGMLLPALVEWRPLPRLGRPPHVAGAGLPSGSAPGSQAGGIYNTRSISRGPATTRHSARSCFESTGWEREARKHVLPGRRRVPLRARGNDPVPGEHRARVPQRRRRARRRHPGHRTCDDRALRVPVLRQADRLLNAGASTACSASGSITVNVAPRRASLWTSM
jgi:hypothetical protein